MRTRHRQMAPMGGGYSAYGYGYGQQRHVPGLLGYGSYSALGYDLPIKTPLGTQTISVPIESLAKAAVAAAWPDVQKKLYAELPKVLDVAQDKVVKELWPKLQPKMRAEIDRGIKQGRTTAYVVTAVVLAGLFGAAWWIKKGR